MFSSARLQVYIGIGLIAIAVLAFLVTLLGSLPKADQVSKQARPLPEIPRNLFASDNEVSQQINKLNVPANVPVIVDPSNIGRSNAFENF